jgi:hypothetical protein
MKYFRLLFAIGLFNLFIDTVSAQDKGPVELVTAGKFKVGQIWKYDNRPLEAGSTLTILRIEKYSKGDTIVHIRVDGIRMVNPRRPGGYSTYLGHLPYSIKALSNEVRSVVGQADHLPDFEEGYQQWRSAWDNGTAGYFTTSVKELINGMEKTMK